MSTVTAVPLRPVKRSYLVWLWIGLALALVSGFALARAGDSGIRVTPSGLRYKVLEAGRVDGPKPTDADVALVNYRGKLEDGKVFDESRQPTPMPVTGVVPGFSEALKLMPKGAKYRIWLPPQLAYGEAGAGNGAIPPNATLTFDVEMLDFLPAAVLQQMQSRGMGPGGPPPAGLPGER